MGRSRGNKKKKPGMPMQFYQTVAPDYHEGRFAMIGASLMRCKEWQKLSPITRLVYISILIESGGRIIFAYSHGSARRYGFSKSSYDRAIAALIASGLISRVLPDEPEERYQFAASKFSFSKQFRSQVILGNAEERKAKEKEADEEENAILKEIGYYN